ncbi:MAG: SRPBCC family protein [Pseudobdellovibrionaceae bacterium]
MTFVWIAIAALVVCGGFAVLVLRKPDQFHYERSRVIHAAPEAIFPLLNAPKEAEKWSPWLEMDPACQMTYSGPDSGMGVTASWVGKKSGEGRQTIVSVLEPNEIITELEFFKPMKGVSAVVYTLTPVEGGTHMSWAMSGPNSLAGKIISVFMNCEKMCGDAFEKGMENIARLVEK